jgi:N-acetylmuramoyl-L-alanine amidase
MNPGLVIIGRAHEPEDQGASIVYDGSTYTEWSLSRDIATATKDVLRAADIHSLIVGGTLSGRIGVARQVHKTTGCDLVLEPHQNSHENPSVNGCFCMVWYTSKASIDLATRILLELARRTPLRNRGLCKCSSNRRWVGTPREYIGAPRLGLLQYTPCPAVIVECSHLTNANDVEYIVERQNRIEVGQAIGHAIKAWFLGREEKNVKPSDSDTDPAGAGD